VHDPHREYFRLSRHSRSLRRRRRKSRCPTIDQVAGTPPTPPADDTVAPFVSQNAALPLPSRQTMPLFAAEVVGMVSTTRWSGGAELRVANSSVNHSARPALS
jgi:hypothetical protein